MGAGRLGTVALWLLIVAAAIYLFERAVLFVSFFGTTLLLFAVAWLIALILQPVVRRVTELDLPSLTRARDAGLPPRHPSRTLAVALVYLAVFALIVVIILSFVPTVSTQLAGLSGSLPDTVATVTFWIAATEDRLALLGFRGDLSAIIEPQAVAEQLAGVGSSAIQQSLGIAGSIASVLFNVFLVLILSFYFTLDGPRLGARFVTLMPLGWRDEVEELFSTVDRVFGGYMRAQLLNSLLYGIANALIMAIFGLRDIALASVVAGVLVLIPLVGGFFALIPPGLFALIEAPDRLLPTLATLLLFQQVLFNAVMPRLVGQAIGLHPLLVFAALLAGGTVAGPWGILFGIPVAGVIASVAQFLYERSRRTTTTVMPPAPPPGVPTPTTAAPPAPPTVDHPTR